MLFLIAAGGFVVFSGTLWIRRQTPPRPLPNILVISLCSVRADHLGCYGYERNTTPKFDSLAKESIVFENAISQWPKTAPSFASIMSGKYGHTTGVMRITPGQYLVDGHETLAEVLRVCGYDTAAFVSSPALNLSTNILKGFETISGTSSAVTQYLGVTDRAAAWLGQERRKPFLLWVHYNNAHYPYTGGGNSPNVFVDDEYYDASLQVKLNPHSPLTLPVPAEHPYRRQILRADIGGVHSKAALKERPTEYAFYIARYDAGIRAADRMAGDLLDTVREMGLLDNTVVVVLGDHGESLGNHNYYFEHGRFPYDDCAKVPLIIRPPGGTEARRIRTPVPIFGIAPTLLEIAGLDAPEAMEARSFWQLAQGRGKPDYVFTESGYQIDYTLSVRGEEWKLIHIPNTTDQSLMKGEEYELYNLSEDPGEKNNLYEDRPEVATRLRIVLDKWSQPWVKQAYTFRPAPDIQLDEETLRRLRSLGYVD